MNIVLLYDLFWLPAVNTQFLFALVFFQMQVKKKLKKFFTKEFKELIRHTPAKKKKYVINIFEIIY